MTETNKGNAELVKVLEKHAWKYLGHNGSQSGWDAPEEDRYVAVIDSTGNWRIVRQWNQDATRETVTNKGVGATELETALSWLDSRHGWKEAR